MDNVDDSRASDQEDRPKRNAGGRPTKYRQEYNKLAYNYCLLGATNESLATFFEVTTSTVELWMVKYKRFSGAIKKGREEADALVAKSLFKRAIGYSYKEVTVERGKGPLEESTAVTPEGDIEKSVEPTDKVKITQKHVPPSEIAQFFWLKNRRPDLWRDKRDAPSKIGENPTFIYNEQPGNDPIEDQ